MKNASSVSRREFVKTTSAAGIGLATAGQWSPLFARRSPGDTIVAAVMGLNGRGVVHARKLARSLNVEVAYLCDVDAQVLQKAATDVNALQTKPAKGVGDFRRALEDKDVDVFVIAAPDHWHTPAAILAMSAGKHVYVEKPTGHNAHEGELLVQAQRRFQKIVQMGTQQRSDARSIEIIQAIKEGLIGTPYMARTWYANSRVGIGYGKTAVVPTHIDYELWQGPAPRAPYRDNLIHYNWHWFRNWGTGEICNNGTHELDIARWALGVEYPTRVASTGGRYHFQDDWEFPDTQEATFDFEGGKTIIWQGQSCNGLRTFGRGRGTAVLGTGGSVVLDRESYAVYDNKNALVKEVVSGQQSDGLNISGDDTATQLHMDNFLEAIRTGATLRQPIEQGVKSVHLCHLGNIAQHTGRTLRIDPASGRILDDKSAMKLWKREYASGWAPVV